jgi:hypothetical protein
MFDIVLYNCRFMLNFAGGLSFETVIKAFKISEKARYSGYDFCSFITDKQLDSACAYVINYQ